MAPHTSFEDENMPKDKTTITCQLLRARWDENGKRHDAGKAVELPVEAAMDAVEAGLVKRVKAEDNDAQA